MNVGPEEKPSGKEETANEQVSSLDIQERQEHIESGEATERQTPDVRKQNGSSRVVKGCLMIAFAVVAILGTMQFGETLALPSQYYYIAGLGLIVYAIYYMTRK